MKCPKLSSSHWQPDGVEHLVLVECLKNQCEWWKETSQLCVMNRLAGELYSLVEVMEEIRDQLIALGKTMGIRG